MFLIPLLLAVSNLCAQEEAKIEELLQSATQSHIENISETLDYANAALCEEAKQTSDDIHYPEEVAEIPEKKVEIEVHESLKGIVEKETAQILQKQKYEDELADKLDPATEDLVLFVKQPKITIAEPASDQGYEKLPITSEDKQKIANILMTMADNNVFKLLFEKKRLERLGHEVNHVHPVRFLGTVFTDPRLIYCMHKIRGSGFKWGGFIDGFSERFKQEINANNVEAYLPGLAEHLHVSVDDLRGYINHQDVEGLILFLMEKSRH